MSGSVIDTMLRHWKVYSQMRRLERRAAEAEEASSQQEAAVLAASERAERADASCQDAQGLPYLQ